MAVRPAFNALRFGAAALVYLLLTLPHQRHFSRADLLGGTSVGVFFTLGLFLQLVGLRYTTPSASAFLTALSVVFAPLAQACILMMAGIIVIANLVIDIVVGALDPRIRFD